LVSRKTNRFQRKEFARNAAKNSKGTNQEGMIDQKSVSQKKPRTYFNPEKNRICSRKEK